MKRSADWIESLNQPLTSEFERLRGEYHFPGGTMAYVLPDGTAGDVAIGFADVEAGERMTPASRMLAASIGKTFVAAVVISLSKEGRLNLDDLLSRWLGNRDWYSRLPNHETITLRHLLTHSTGLPDHVHSMRFYTAFPRMAMEDHFHPESVVECILDAEPLFEAGQGWAYTDTGYILLGLVVEEATGHKYYDELQERFLKPLKLDRTSPSDQKKLPGLVQGYTDPTTFGFVLPRKTLDKSGAMVWNPVFEWTGGGLISTSHDLAKWAKLLYEGRAMSADYLDDLLKSVRVSNEEPNVRFGAAVLIDPNSPLGEKWGHGGIIPGYGSSMRYYPKYGISVAYQINTDENIGKYASDMEHRLAKIVIDIR